MYVFFSYQYLVLLLNLITREDRSTSRSVLYNRLWIRTDIIAFQLCAISIGNKLGSNELKKNTLLKS